MMPKLILIFVLAVAARIPVATAQNMDFGLSLDGGFPVGTFKENVGSNGFGIDGIFTIGIPRSPLSVGLDFGFITYGNRSRKEVFNPNIPEVLIGVRTTNNIFTGHVVSRLESKRGAVRPYADGLVGLHYLWTESRVEDDDRLESIASTTNFDDTAFSYGLGGGLKFKVAESVTEEGRPVAWFIDIRARYLFGGQAEYLREGALRNNNGVLEYDTSYSNTDLMTIGLGFIVRL